ncbi:MAG TPA: S8 family peptidase [Geminicoccaceae bacterium]
MAGCGGGGGGGGSSGSLSSHPPGFFETAEYFANRGLKEIEASSAYAAGGTGKGIIVGVVDTGIDLDHPELAGVIDDRSIDIVSGSAATLGDVDGHGTAVGGIIAARRNGALSHGVAFASRLLVVRADAPGSCPGACAFDPAAVAAATDYAIAHGARVINYSIGGAGSLDGALGDALERAVDAGRIVVLAAGNEGGVDPVFPAIFAGTPEARGRALAVGALDVDGELASFSNRAGSAREYFLVAPGVQILAPELNGDAAPVSGTSFATPHVTGAVALVLEAAPFLEVGEVVELLLETATDLGDPGTDAIYGRGLLNLAAALSPQGPLAIPVGGSVDGAAAALGATGLRLGGAFGPGPELGRAIFLDRYGRPYWIDLDRRRTTTKIGPDLYRWLAPDRGHLTFSPPLGSGAALSLHLDAPLERPAFKESWGEVDTRLEENFALSAGLGEASRLTVTHGWSLQGQFGLQGEEAGAAPGLLTGGVFASPYLALADGGDGVALAHRLGDGWSMRVGLGRAGRGGQGGYGAGDNTVMLGELVRAMSDRWRLGIQFGQLEEHRRMLDASGGGALGLPAGASTTFLGFTGRAELAPRLELFGQGNVGLTRPHGAGPGLLQDISALSSSSFGLGFVRRALAAKGDRLTVAISQPLRVEAGAARIDRPIGRTFDGRIVRQRARVDLAPTGRELDLELGYRLALPGAGELGLNWLTRLQPGHDVAAEPQHAVALKLRHRW